MSEWTKEEIAKLVDLKQSPKNLSWVEIGNLLKKSSESCRAKWKRLRRSGKLSGAFREWSEGNKKTITYQGETIKSPEELMEHAKINPDDWVILKQKVGKWDMGRKETYKELEWDDARMSGWIEDTGTLAIQQLFSVEVILVRKNPEEIFPVLKPIEIVVGKYQNKGTKPIQKEYKTAIALADFHTGFMRNFNTGKLLPLHDRQALDCVLQFLEYFSKKFGLIDELPLLGDLVDFSEWSERFAREPESYFTTQPTLIELGWWLSRYEQYAEKVTYLEGNHEIRFPNFVKKNFLAGYNLKAIDDLDNPLLTLKNFLCLDKMGIEYLANYPNNRYYLNDSTICVHGSVAKATSGASANQYIQNYNINVLFGHVHRRELVWKKWNGRELLGLCPGMLAKNDGELPGSKDYNNWTQGIGIIYYNEDEILDAQLIKIDDGKLYYDGRVFYGEELREDMKGDIGHHLMV